MKTFGSFHKETNVYTFAGEPLAIHTDYYNCYLHKAIMDLGQYIDVQEILVNSAQAIAFTQFSKCFEKHPKWDIAQRKEKAAEYFAYCGFGKVDLKNLQRKGGYIETKNEHYGVAWKKVYGDLKSDQAGVAQFLMGFLCGVTEAVHDIALGTFDAKQITCISKGDAVTRIDVFRGLRKKLQNSVGEGETQSFEGQPAPDLTSVNYESVMDKILEEPIAGDEKTGLIEDKFGSNITRHYANYYNLLSIRVLMALEKKYKREGLVKAKTIILQSARMSAFHLIGRLISSKEWETIISPSVNNTDDQLHGILAFINTLGWGRWEIERFNPSGKTTFNILSSSESNSFVKMVGQTKAPICFFLEGMVTALMNMVYNTKLLPNMELNDELFNSVFKAENRFVVVDAKTRLMGEPSDRFTVARKA